MLNYLSLSRSKKNIKSAMDEKVEALLDNKEYEAAFDLIEKENFENFKKPQIQGMNHESKESSYFDEAGFDQLHVSDP